MSKPIGARWRWALIATLMSVAGCSTAQPPDLGRSPLRAGPFTVASAHPSRSLSPTAPGDGPASGASPEGEGVFSSPPASDLRRPTDFQADDRRSGPQRVAEARRAKQAVVERLFAKAKVAFPPAELLLVGYKAEAELEVWASSAFGEPMRRVATYGVCATSGELGPKRREGDGQVPEGFYRVAYLWPKSAFHLAMKVSYPNVADRRLGHPTMPGSNIMIHGGCASIGCLAMSDERIREIYLMGDAARGRPIAIHLHPARDFEALRDHPLWVEHGALWSNLAEGRALFESTGRPPRVEVDRRGRYRFEPG